ncbi:MAG: rRNA pseudouridine synthase [Firmicutes bacterium]|nr:rRNA pseudouridine synthase [Bacillota bacterium]
MAKIRLDKYITMCGNYTRTQAKKLIHQKRVTVGGLIVTDEGFKADENSENICIDGIPAVGEKYTYIMLNKPAGVISATDDKKHRTVLDLIGEDVKRDDLFPAGRLDIDTEGLLILTNDGVFAHNTLSPKKHVKKVYLVHAENYKYSEESRQRFLNGIEIDGGYICKGAVLELIEETPEYTALKLEITEGKFHQVKRMIAAEGGNVIYLKRLSFGRITLDESLRPGEYRRLNAEEMQYIKERNGDKT